MLCRLCVQECSDFTNIFEGEGLTIDIANLIATYFTFEVTPDDEHSTIVCRNCFDNLCNFYTFCITVENSQENWQIDQDPLLKEQLVEESESCPTDNDNTSMNDEISESKFSQSYNSQDQVSEENHSNCADTDSITCIPEDKCKKSKLSEGFDRLISSYTTLFCNECNETMQNFKVLKKHFKQVHGKGGYMICCKRKYFRAADLADHINIHLNPEHFKCMQCGKCFSSRYSLDFHQKTFHVNDNNERQCFKCKHCSRAFSKKNMLERHKQIHFGTNLGAKDHLCKECGKGYPTESKLKAHHFNVHTMLYTRMCHLCGKSVRGNKALERHQLQHAGIKPKVQCEICGIKLSTKGILKAHMIALHPEDDSETHVCNECGKNAPSKRALKYHMDYVHRCERSHKCNLCDKSFKRPQTLKEHMTTHTGDRLYECPHCPKTFKVCSNMHHHRKLKHPKEFEETRKNRTERI